MDEIRRGDIYYANLHPVVGSEQGGIRPVLIIQNDIGNHLQPDRNCGSHHRRKKKHIPTHVRLAEDGLKRESHVLLEQIRTLDRRRLLRYVNHLDKEAMRLVDRAISISLGAVIRSRNSFVAAARIWPGNKPIIDWVWCWISHDNSCILCIRLEKGGERE